ncbi:heterokaryon incompatibility protein-domain-containing protein [Lasiosphaeria ovina]|uniref:Heterokaryon incompatibility protein-domain-containing protein n=1 Tax=Lasiosphaeria ovina TaxID=92902 RepID=A0AAE0MZL3_9PEZI|nr:heterokaryon incompatibility protein-domain-containing protein [Lasiosphaeria ovina]
MAPYSSLPKGSVRLLRLLPHPDKNSHIQCRLTTFSMFDSGSTHPYESLSYMWGSDDNKQPIYVDSDELYVTVNLHAALSHLRHCFLERILWVDAICINQDDKDEKGRQIYRVIVWLGEAADGSDQALENIRAAADEEPANSLADKTNRKDILTLLERGWFERIWVLQEVAAARNILIKCSPTEIDGYAFCSGLSALNLSYETHPHLLGLIPPIVYLIRGAVFRPRYEGDKTSLQDRFSLGIRPLGQLVDMYHTHKATVPLDKGEVFHKLVQFCLSDQMFISTWDGVEAAVIEARCCILGEVSSVGEDATRHNRPNGDPTRHDRRHVSAKAVNEGDVVCLLQGASAPTIVRLCDGFSTIIMIAVPLTDDVRKRSASVTAFLIGLLVVWDWDESRRKFQDGEDYEKLISSRKVPKSTRLWNFGVLLNKIERYENAAKNVQKAVEIYSSREILGSREADEEVLRIMDDLLLDDRSVNIEAEYKEHSQAPLSWAAAGGHEAVVRLLLEKGASIDLKDEHCGWTPLSWAAAGGHEAVVRLLLEKGVSVDLRDMDGQTPLSLAAAMVYKAVVRLLKS